MGEDEVLEAVRELRARGRNATIDAIARALSATAGEIEAPLMRLVDNMRLFELTEEVEWCGDPAQAKSETRETAGSSVCVAVVIGATPGVLCVLTICS